MNWQQKLWKGGQTFLYAVRPLLLYLFVPGILHLMVSFFLPYTVEDPQYQKASGNFYNCVGILAAMYLLNRISKKRGSTIFKDTTLILENPDWRFIAFCAGLGAAVALAFSALITVLPLPGILMNSYEADSKRVFLQLDFILALINLVVVCPLMEEIVIRGYMLNRLFAFFTQKQAIYLSAFVFAICHVNPLWIFYAFFLGVFMAKLALKRDNILYSLCFHVGFNFPAAVNACIMRAGFGEAVFFKSKVLVALYGTVAMVSAVLIWRQMAKEDSL